MTGVGFGLAIVGNADEQHRSSPVAQDLRVVAVENLVDGRADRPVPLQLDDECGRGILPTWQKDHVGVAVAAGQLLDGGIAVDSTE